MLVETAVKQNIYNVSAALFAVEFSVEFSVKFVAKYVAKYVAKCVSIHHTWDFNATRAPYKLVWWLDKS